jgi:transposase
MKTLSADLRRRVVVFYAEHKGEGATYESTATHFAVGRATVDRWLRLKRETGDVAVRPRKVVVRSPLRMDWLKEHVETQPDATLKARAKEHQAVHGGKEPSIAAIWQALCRLGFTHKKKRSSPKRESRSASSP